MVILYIFLGIHYSTASIDIEKNMNFFKKKKIKKKCEGS